MEVSDEFWADAMNKTASTERNNRNMHLLSSNKRLRRNSTGGIRYECPEILKNEEETRIVQQKTTRTIATQTDPNLLDQFASVAVDLITNSVNNSLLTIGDTSSIGHGTSNLSVNKLITTDSQLQLANVEEDNINEKRLQSEIIETVRSNQILLRQLQQLSQLSSTNPTASFNISSASTISDRSDIPDKSVAPLNGSSNNSRTFPLPALSLDSSCTTSNAETKFARSCSAPDLSDVNGFNDDSDRTSSSPIPGEDSDSNCTDSNAQPVSPEKKDETQNDQEDTELPSIKHNNSLHTNCSYKTSENQNIKRNTYDNPKVASTLLQEDINSGVSRFPEVTSSLESNKAQIFSSPLNDIPFPNFTGLSEMQSMSSLQALQQLTQLNQFYLQHLQPFNMKTLSDDNQNEFSSFHNLTKVAQNELSPSSSNSSSIEQRRKRRSQGGKSFVFSEPIMTERPSTTSEASNTTSTSMSNISFDAQSPTSFNIYNNFLPVSPLLSMDNRPSYSTDFQKGKKRNSKNRKRRRNEWCDEEIITLLQITKIMIDCELKSIAQALFHCIQRSPGKSYGRAAEKKLKRMDIFENWKKCDRNTTIRNIDKKLSEYGVSANQIKPEVFEIANRYRDEELRIREGTYQQAIKTVYPLK